MVASGAPNRNRKSPWPVARSRFKLISRKICIVLRAPPAAFARIRTDRPRRTPPSRELLAIHLLRLDGLGHRVHELVALSEARLGLGKLHALLHEFLAVDILVVEQIDADARLVRAMPQARDHPFDTPRCRGRGRRTGPLGSSISA